MLCTGFMMLILDSVNMDIFAVSLLQLGCILPWWVFWYKYSLFLLSFVKKRMVVCGQRLPTEI